MKKTGILFISCFIAALSFAQQTFTYRDPQEKFNEAKEYYQKGLYNLAYPIFKELQTTLMPIIIMVSLLLEIETTVRP
jgi:hypothetical protein